MATWKHHERSRLHLQRVRQYRKRLAELSGIDLSAISAAAEEEHMKIFGSSALYESRAHLIWKAFPLIISAIGLALLCHIVIRIAQ